MSNRVWRWIGMYEEHRLAALKFCENRLQNSIAQVHALRVREENKTIELKDVECVRQFFERVIDVRQRETSETCKAVRCGMNEFGRELVASPRQRPSLLAITKVHSRRAH